MLRPLLVAAAALTIALVFLYGVGSSAAPIRSLAQTQSTPRAYLPQVSDQPTPTPGYSDDFSNPNTGYNGLPWVTGTLYDASNNPIATLDYLSGTFQILFSTNPAAFQANPSGYLIRAGDSLLATDFQASMQVWAASSVTTGSNGFYFGSIPCVGNGTPSGFYDFEVGDITGPSQFYLARWNYNQGDSTCTTGTWTQLYPAGTTSNPFPPPATSSAILSGNQVNYIEVTRSGTLITLYANETQLAQVNDSTTNLTGAGYVGLAASSASPGFDARFDNFLLLFSAPTSSSLSTTSLREEKLPPLKRAPLK